MKEIKGKVLKFERKIDSVRGLDVRSLTEEQIRALDVRLLSVEQIFALDLRKLSDEQLDILKSSYTEEETEWVRGLTNEEIQALKRGDLHPPPGLFL